MANCIKGSPDETHFPAHWNLISRSKTAPAACVIAQQYSSAICISEEKIQRTFQKGYLQNSSAFWVTKRREVVLNRRFGTTNWSHLKS
jgi:hypothetical protein